MILRITKATCTRIMTERESNRKRKLEKNRDSGRVKGLGMNGRKRGK